ncbi:hypothetical protein HWV62_6449 [Athelia sp. TMB]|nr:hypothetical protein HWV62_6449 [Athelia sp. TMB]
MSVHVLWKTFLLLLCTAPFSVSAQSGNATSATAPSLSLSTAVFNSTSSYASTIVSRSAGRSVSITTELPTLISVTSIYTATISPTASATPSATPSPAPIRLDTKVDGAFGALGALLILTGLPSAFWGHKNRWSSIFLVGFYTLSLVCIVLILKFGVLGDINPPSETLRGLFVFACFVAGVAGGGISIFFWKSTKYFIGAWGGLALGLWIECFKDGGLIHQVGIRWIMYIGNHRILLTPTIALAALGFVLCTIPKLHLHVLLVSTAFVGSSAFVLGVDCYTTAGLKEFYLWNIGFNSLFPKYVDNGIQFPVTQTIQIELGLIAAVALMGGAVQLRVLAILQGKLKDMAEEQKKREEEIVLRGAGQIEALQREKEEWEKEHPTLPFHQRQTSYTSSAALLKSEDHASPSESPMMDDKRLSTVTFGVEGRPRHYSNVSDFMADPDHKRAVLQSPGALPAMDLGIGLKDDVPLNYLQGPELPRKSAFIEDFEELARKEALLSEIQEMRRSIDALKSDSHSSSGGRSRLSMHSRRTLSFDAESMLSRQPGFLRPPRQGDPRNRVQSMELDRLTEVPMIGASIGRPKSVPLKDDKWDAYVQERKLLQPPSGITAPIPTTPLAPRVAMSPAVAEAFTERKQRESAFLPETDSDNIPLAAIAQPKAVVSTTNNIPVILPRQQAASPISTPAPPRPQPTRTATYEELAERHRRKMREMQAPLTQAQKEQAQLDDAKSRWEKSKENEKVAVAKRQAEQAAQYSKRKSEEEPKEPLKLDMSTVRRHSRHMSTDRITGSSSKRMSTMKVEDWQKYQQEQPATVTRHSGSRSPGPSPISPVPFPDSSRRDSGYERRSKTPKAGFPPN